MRSREDFQYIGGPGWCGSVQSACVLKLLRPLVPHPEPKESILENMGISVVLGIKSSEMERLLEVETQASW